MPVGRDPPVAVGREEVVERQRRGERRPAGAPSAAERHEDGQRPHEVGGDREPGAPLPRHEAQARHVGGLEIAKAAVHDAEAVAGGPRAEVVPLEQRDGKPPERRVARHGGALDAAADDHEIERPAVERREVAAHAPPS